MKLSSFSLKRTLISFFVLSLFFMVVGVGVAGTLVLESDYSCDNITDLDDYTVLVRDKRLSTRKLSILFKEWGSRGLSNSTDCSGKAVTANNGGYGGAGSTTPTPTPSPTPVVSPTPTPTPVTTTSPSPSPSSKPSPFNLSDSNLVAYMPMEETAGSLTNKKTSNAVANLIPNGNVQYRQTGKVGYGVKVNGIGNAFCSGSGTACKDVKAYDFTGDYTLGMWVKLDQGSAYLFRKWDQEKGNYSYFALDSNIFLAALAHPHPDYLFGYDHGLRAGQPTGRSYVEGYMDLNVDNKLHDWHHITVVRDTKAKTVFLYVDGKKQDTHPGQIKQANGGVVTSVMRADNQVSADPFRLGELVGTIDEFFAYKKALTETEVKAIYEAGK